MDSFEITEQKRIYELANEQLRKVAEAQKARDEWRDCFFGLVFLLTLVILYHYFPQYFPSESELEQAQAWWQ
jgi:hypothetical protein